MQQPLSREQIEALRAIDSPTISNAIEPFNVRPRNQGFMTPDIRSVFPEMGPIVGYAATAVISATRPEGHTVPRRELWEHVLSIPQPRIMVIHDVDDPAVGAFWGEVQSNIFTALGCIGCVTDGSVRDLDEVRKLGFNFVTKWVTVSHAYVHVIDVGTPITVGGLVVRPGDLLHADQHGAISIPHETAPQIPDAIAKLLEKERQIIGLCQSPDFSIERLGELAG